MTGNDADRPRVIALPPLIYLGFFLAGLGLEALWPAAFLPQAIQYAVGGLVIALSVVIAITTFARFHKADTTFDVRKPATTLIIEGTFRYTRNPLYLALLMLYLGGAVMVDGGWIVALAVPLVAVMTYGVILPEERHLTAKFGEDYRSYRASVRRWI